MLCTTSSSFRCLPHSKDTRIVRVNILECAANVQQKQQRPKQRATLPRIIIIIIYVVCYRLGFFFFVVVFGLLHVYVWSVDVAPTSQMHINLSARKASATLQRTYWAGNIAHRRIANQIWKSLNLFKTLANTSWIQTIINIIIYSFH